MQFENVIRTESKLQKLRENVDEYGLIREDALLSLLSLELDRKTPVSVVVCQIEGLNELHFKHSEFVGSFLAQFSEFLSERRRSADYYGRVGKDFVMVLIDTDVHGSRQFCDRLRDGTETKPGWKVELLSCIARAARKVPEGNLVLSHIRDSNFGSLKLGFASVNEGESANELIKRAKLSMFLT